MRIIYIYKNKQNSKIYVGQTKNLDERKVQHKYEALSRNTNYPLYNSIRKYGLDNFDILELESVEDNFIDSREEYWIQFFKSYDRDYGYNLELGGCKNKFLSKETRLKMSQTRNRNFENGITIPSMLGKHHTTETKQKISNANLGKCYNSLEHMNNLHRLTSERLLGTNISQEIRNKISKSHIGFKHTEVSKQKMSNTRIERGTFVGEKNPNFGKIGELNPSSILTWDIVNNIRLDYSLGLKGKKLMKKYDISETNMYRILKNETWKV